MDEDVQDYAELVLSGLVTNVLKAPAPRGRQIGLGIVRPAPDGWLRLAVSDGGGGVPALRVPGEDEAGGTRWPTAGVYARTRTGAARPGGPR